MYNVAFALYESFKHFYYLDCSNAAIHISKVRFSPITFQLGRALKQRDVYKVVVTEGWSEDELMVVWSHEGAYEEDKGR